MRAEKSIIDIETYRIREKSVQTTPKDTNELELLLKAKNKTHI